MNGRLRLVLWIFLAACVVVVATAPVLASFVTQRDQISITIVVNVTPAPVSMLETHPARGSADDIAVTGRVRERIVAQASAQKPVRVEASVTPNPNATLLYSDNPIVVVNATAGTSVTIPCAYHVNVHTTTNNWQLKHGLSDDFGSGFAGATVANNSYLLAPNPTATPFIVYADDGHVWASLATNSGIKQYCVDLTIKVPVAVAGGAYSTNAVYTLYW